MLIHGPELEPTFHSRIHMVYLNEKKFINWLDSKILEVVIGFWYLGEV